MILCVLPPTPSVEDSEDARNIELWHLQHCDLASLWLVSRGFCSLVSPKAGGSYAERSAQEGH